jgi:hypothetical protein
MQRYSRGLGTIESYEGLGIWMPECLSDAHDLGAVSVVIAVSRSDAV